MSVCVCREGWWGGWLQQSFQAVKDKVSLHEGVVHGVETVVLLLSIYSVTRIFHYLQPLLPSEVLDVIKTTVGFLVDNTQYLRRSEPKNIQTSRRHYY